MTEITSNNAGSKPASKQVTGRDVPALPVQRHLGAAISLWHVALAFAGMAASYWALATDGVPSLRGLVANPSYFKEGHPLLFDQRRQGYSVDEAREHLSALGTTASQYYADTYLALYDLVFPLLLLAFGVLLILYATNRAHPHAIDVTPMVQRLMLAVPIALFVFDMCENLFLYSALGMYPTVNTKVIETASLFTQLKWLAAFIEGVLLLGLIVYTAHSHVETGSAKT